LGEYAFSGCGQLAEVRLPESLVKISAYAFASTGLKSVTLPNGVNELGEGAFDGCDQLAEVRLPESLVKISAYAFANTGLKSVRVPKRTEIAGNAFPSSTRVERFCAADWASGCLQLAPSHDFPSAVGKGAETFERLAACAKLALLFV
jgi:hypothetical protein